MGKYHTDIERVKGTQLRVAGQSGSALRSSPSLLSATAVPTGGRRSRFASDRMDIGAEVWLRDKSFGWVSAIIVEKSKIEVKVRIKDGSIQTVNESDIEPKNKVDDQVDNLINLTYLNEPAILRCLEVRYASSSIYTYTGPILIALNPFRSLEAELYHPKILEKYYNYGLLKSQGNVDMKGVAQVGPHVYAIADNAYRSMMRVVLNGPMNDKDTAHQSILISGESGAGKTESTKLLLRYLTTVSAETKELTATGTIMDKVLQSNPILEAFGNARTIRNDNSSRFGKFVELNFDKSGFLVGGLIRTYLLEKVRLCFQQVGERNYHIFYQMAKGGNETEKKRWSISRIEDFRFANQGNTFSLRFIDDKEEYDFMKNALETLDFSTQNAAQMLDIAAGILHVGQIVFASTLDGEGSEIATDASTSSSLNAACSLLGLPPTTLKKM